MKTKIMKAIALCLALVLCFGSAISVSAAEVADAPIDESQKGSLTIFKYDLTGSENAGIWDSSYVSTGVADESGVNETMKNYALEGVEYSFVKVADIVQFTESTADNRTDNHVEVLYAIDKVQGADFLKALGLENGAQRYTNADALDSAKYFYQSDVLIHALSAALTANSTVVKNAMEQYIAAIGGTAMPLTDSFGKTKAENLALGLYLIVETKVPENVVSTTDPFLISLPMTSVNGTNATDGGTRWVYDVTVYPKNQTGDPTLEKTLREQAADTGKNNGTSGITDGFAHTGTASGGDTVEYQIISTLPAITSESTYLTTYTFVDTLSKGVTYAKGDVVLEFFTDSTGTDSVAKWTEADGKFTASYIAQLKNLFEKQWESILGNCDEFLYLGGNETGTHKMIAESYLGKQTIDLNTYGKSSGRSGNYSTNWQITGRELLDAAEVRMLDNRYALLFIRGEMPIMDEKYDLLNHPNVKFTPEKGGMPYVHGGTELSVGSLSLSTVSGKETKFINLSEIEFELLSDEEIEAELLTGGKQNEEHH